MAIKSVHCVFCISSIFPVYITHMMWSSVVPFAIRNPEWSVLSCSYLENKINYNICLHFVKFLIHLGISLCLWRQFWLLMAPSFSFFLSLVWFPELPKSNGFLIIEANGGLNQQRLSVCFILWSWFFCFCFWLSKICTNIMLFRP